MREQARQTASVRPGTASRHERLMRTFLTTLISNATALLEELADEAESRAEMATESDASATDEGPLSPNDLDYLSFDLVVAWQVHHRRHRRPAGQAELCAVFHTSRSTLHRRLVKAGIDWEEATQQAMHTAERLLIESDMAPRPHAESTAAPHPPSATGRLAIHPAVEP